MAQPAEGPLYLTVEEFETYDVPDDMQAELVRGELRLTPPPGFLHGVVAARLMARIGGFVESRALGFVTANSCYELVGLYRTVRAPVIAFVSASRLSPDDIPLGVARLRPDLAIEVFSPSETRARLNEKLDDFEAVDVPLVWVVDPERRTVSVIEKGEPPCVLSHDDVLDGGITLPGFTIRVSEIF